MHICNSSHPQRYSCFDFKDLSLYGMIDRTHLHIRKAFYLRSTSCYFVILRRYIYIYIYIYIYTVLVIVIIIIIIIIIKIIITTIIIIIIKESCKRITQITLEPLETQYLFQRLSISLQRGNEIAFRNTFTTE